MSKSPKRKLKFEIISRTSPKGRQTTYRVIRKELLDHYVLIRGWSLKDFRIQFGIGHRLYRQSMKHWYTTKQLHDIHADKIKKSQLKNNSNKANYNKPRQVIELDRLKKAISTSDTQREVLEKLRISKYKLTSNLQYHNLHFNPLKHLTRTKFLSLSPEDLQTLEYIAILKPETYSSIYRVLKSQKGDLQEALNVITDLYYNFRLLRRKLSKTNRKFSRNNRPISSIVEYNIKLYLDSLGVNYTPQFYIKPYWYDFLLIGKNLLIEVDGGGHQDKTDKVKEKLAKSQGYTVLRVTLASKGKGIIPETFKTKLLPYV